MLLAVLSGPTSGAGDPPFVVTRRGRSGSLGGDPRVATLREHESPARENSGESRLTVGEDGELYLSWIERVAAGHRLRFSRRETDRWTSPRTISEGADWFVNWADFPSLAVLADGTLAAHWLQKNGPGTYAYDVRISLSRDKGQSWSPSFTPHRDGRPAEHGFASMVTHGDDRFGIFWLDGRSMVDAEGQPIPGSNMSLRYTTFDRSGVLGKEMLVDDRVCECCQTGAVVVSGNRSFVVYRDRSKAEVRDIGRAWIDAAEVQRLKPVHEDRWVIEGCPVNGPAVRRFGAALAVAWYTEGDAETSSIRLAWSTDEGRTFGEPIRIDSGNAIGRVDLAMESAQSCVVTWVDARSGSATIRARRVRRDRASGQSWALTTTQEARAAGFPRIALWRGQWVMAWTDAARRRVRVATFELPEEAPSPGSDPIRKDR